MLALNPQRERLILEMTGWDRLEPGTLNLHLPERQIAEFLQGIEPLFVEPGTSVKYAEGYAHIPRKRKSYCHYRGTSERCKAISKKLRAWIKARPVDMAGAKAVADDFDPDDVPDADDVELD